MLDLGATHLHFGKKIIKSLSLRTGKAAMPANMSGRCLLFASLMVRDDLVSSSASRAQTLVHQRELHRGTICVLTLLFGSTRFVLTAKKLLS
ncbi:MAG: hypothetical protein JST92_26900 [Deltaproteobacteria bacterium]|nr:hypothetical protein [Deltaproteobacteria bacterium]